MTDDLHATGSRAAIETPYWIRPGGAVFEAAWATDRRDELEKLLDDVYRTAYQAGALNG